jgi:hypothetical protein
MNFRLAFPSDIEQIQSVRNAVTENKLSDPRLITDKAYLEYLTRRGRGWVCESGGVKSWDLQSST